MLKIIKGGFKLNGQLTKKLIGRSAFKLANILTYSAMDRGHPKWNHLYVRRYVDKQQSLFGEHVVLRVLLETGGWDPKTNGMFGSSPSDQGFWKRELLRDGNREIGMHPVGRNVLKRLYRISHETGVVFELVIDATLKHDNIPAGEIDHVIRQVGIRMGGLNNEFPKALIIPNCRNEWNAHNGSEHSLNDVNMWARRWDRDDYTSKEMRPVVCPGGGDRFTYDVGPEPGKFAMGLIHPVRDRDWMELPDMKALREDCRGMPLGFNESMYYVERRNFDRATGWYRHRMGWTHNLLNYIKFAEAAIDETDYFILHDEDGTGCDSTRTGPSRLEGHFGRVTAPPPPPPPPPPPESALDKLVHITQKIHEVVVSNGSQLNRLESKLDSIAESIQGMEKEPIPDKSGKKATDYIPWADREFWAGKLNFAYTIWRGERDLSAITDPWLNTVGMNREELNSTIKAMSSVSATGDRLMHRIRTEKHKLFSDRCQVRKEVAHEMKRLLSEQSDIYYEIAKKFPDVPGCDSIKCKVQKLGQP